MDEQKVPPEGVPDPQGSQTPTTLDKLLTLFKQFASTPSYIVKLVFAVFVSTFYGKREPLWLLIIGNPSTNKTTIVDLIKRHDEVFRVDALTANPFSSGQRESDKPQDLLPKLNRKCFVVKEYGTILGRSDEVVKQLISDMVAIFDGEYTKHSPTRGTVKHEVYFSHIGCVTPAVFQSRHNYMNRVGARFLCLRMPELEASDIAAGLARSWDDEENERLKEEATELGTLLCEELKDKADQLQDITFPEEVKEAVNTVAQFVCNARGTILAESTVDSAESSKENGEKIGTQIEGPFRLVKQLKKLLQCYALVEGEKMVMLQHLHIVSIIAFSSIPLRRATVLSVFHTNGSVTVPKAAHTLQVHERFVRRQFDELVTLGILDVSKDENDKAATYSIKPQFKQLFLYPTEI